MTCLQTETVNHPFNFPSIAYHANCFLIERERCWRQCREQFHRVLNESKQYDFWYNPTHLDDLVRMIDWLESTLNIKKQFRTKVYIASKRDSFYHDKKQPIKIVPGKFWHNAIKIQFLSIAVKSSQRRLAINKSIKSKYKVSRPLRQLLQSSYCRETPIATGRFLLGKTDSKRAIHIVRNGWVHTFSASHRYWRRSNVSELTSSQRLIEPTAKKKLSLFQDNKTKSTLSRGDQDYLSKWLTQKKVPVNVR